MHVKFNNNNNKQINYLIHFDNSNEVKLLVGKNTSPVSAKINDESLTKIIKCFLLSYVLGTV